MVEILVSIENDKYEKPFISLLKELKYISSYKKAKNGTKKLKPSTEADWIRQGRPATEEEISQMLEESEKGPFFTLEEAKKLTLNEFDEWKQT
jgi:hypothetical protein